MITPAYLRQILAYDPDTGEFTWKESRSHLAAGSNAGRKNRDGYSQIQIDGRKYSAHRLAWLLVHGRWPANQIDHRNGVRDDNRLANLREALPSENQHNCRISARNTSGIKGVSWNKQAGKWGAHIRVSRRQIFLGHFDNVELAGAAYTEASQKYHGEFGRIK